MCHNANSNLWSILRVVNYRRQPAAYWLRWGVVEASKIKIVRPIFANPFLFFLKKNTHFQNTGQHIQRRFFAIVSCGPFDKTVATRLYDTNFTLDICAVIQGIAVCMLIDCDAVFHLCHHWHAGMFFRFFFCVRFEKNI